MKYRTQTKKHNGVLNYSKNIMDTTTNFSGGETTSIIPVYSFDFSITNHKRKIGKNKKRNVTNKRKTGKNK